MDGISPGVRPCLNQQGRGRRVAIVHEWLETYAGSERVVRELLAMFPDAELFALVDFLNDEDREKLFFKRARTSFLQGLPWARRRFRAYLPLMPLAIEQLDVSDYDIVISSSHAVAKGVLTGPDQIHICYCHTPIRYAWDLQHQYLRQSGRVRGLKSAAARVVLHYIRQWDVRTAHGVDQFIANSAYIARRIKKTYGRGAAVVHPPVDIAAFPMRREKEEFFVTASRLVPYKRVDLIVEAFAAMPEKQLVVIGDGPEMANIARLAGPNVRLLGYQPDDVLRDYLQRARAFVCAAEEDFGILLVEALACGTPVIAYGRGGAREIVAAEGNELGLAPAGIFFEPRDAAALREAILRFEARDFAPEACRACAERFAAEHFREGIRLAMADVEVSVLARPPG